MAGMTGFSENLLNQNGRHHRGCLTCLSGDIGFALGTNHLSFTATPLCKFLRKVLVSDYNKDAILIAF